MKIYLGIDVGSVTTKFASITPDNELVHSLYLLTGGKPVEMVQEGLKRIAQELPADCKISGVATTGSARYLAGAIVGADLVKNEITCQAVGAVDYLPDVRTVIEIGGQDSKIIIIRDGMVADFGMNTVCAAGTGSFLDHQAARLGITIEELSRKALESKSSVDITGRCTVFAESDMVHRQQMGYSFEDIIYGLCRALVRNFLSDVASGKDIQTPVVFQGGVAFNRGIIRAFREELKADIIVPPHHEVIGAIGAACLAKEYIETGKEVSRFRGFEVSDTAYRTSSFKCRECPTACEISRISAEDREIACWGGQCDMWDEKYIDHGVN